MAVSDLSAVTKILMKVFDEAVADPMWLASAGPPNLDQADKSLYVHLFHIREEAHRKNFPPPFEPPVGGSGPSPISLSPLALSLYYVVTPVAFVDDPAVASTTALDRQKVLGAVAKAVHDYPVIDTGTHVYGTPLFSSDGGTLDDALLEKGDRIELILRPLTPEDAVTFWSAEQTETPQPSVYLEARVALLPPVEPTEISGIVLTVGNYIFVGFPQLVRTRSVVTVLPPTTTQPMPLQATPARVSIFSSDLSLADAGKEDNNLLIIDGASLSAATRKLVLSGPGGVRVAVRLSEPTQNDDWEPMFPATGITVHVRQNPVDDDTGDTIKLVPGAYTLRVSLEDIESGQARASNSVPFMLTPEMWTPAQQGATVGTLATYAASVEGDLIPSATNPAVGEVVVTDQRADEDIQLVVSGAVLTPIEDGATPQEGQWEHTFDGPNQRGTITFVLDTSRFGSAPSEFQPLPAMLVINGATSPVVWVPVPTP